MNTGISVGISVGVRVGTAVGVCVCGVMAAPARGGVSPKITLAHGMAFPPSCHVMLC